MLIKKMLLAVGAICAAFVVLGSPLFAQHKQGRDLNVLCANGMKGVLLDLQPQLETAVGRHVTISFGEAGDLKKRIAGGEAADVVILPRTVLDQLQADGKLAPGSVENLAQTAMGIGIRENAPTPDVSSPEALKKIFLSARSIAITDPSSGGVSGLHIMEVFRRLGIAEEVQSKLKLNRGALNAELVANGEADVAVQLAHEIHAVRGVTFIPLPQTLQRIVIFSAAVVANTRRPEAASAVLRFLKSNTAVTVVRAKRMDAPSVAEIQPQPLFITVEGSCVCHIAMFVGNDLEIFRKHGIDVHFVMVPTGVDAVRALGERKVEVGAAAIAVIASGISTGTPMKAIFAAFGDATGNVPTDNMLAIVARKSRRVREGHIEDLKGKKIGVPRGTIAHLYLYYALAAKGVDGITQVSVVPTPPSGLAHALDSGAVDAVAIWEPTASTVAQTVRDSFVVQRGGNYVEFLDLRFVPPQLLTDKADLVKRYIIAYAEAAQYARLHPEEAVDILMKYVPDLDKDTVQRVFRYVSLDMRVSKATADRARQSFDFLVKLGALKERPDFEDMIDLRLFDEVAKEHPELFSDLPVVPTNIP